MNFLFYLNFLFSLNILIILSNEVIVDLNGEISILNSLENNTKIPEISQDISLNKQLEVNNQNENENENESQLEVIDENESDKKYESIQRLTKNNYKELIKNKPISVLIISDEKNELNFLFNIFLDSANEFHKHPDLTGIQFLHLDANSLSCEFLVGNNHKDGVLSVREVLFQENVIKPQCKNSKKDDNDFKPGLWLIHWRDYSLISPLRLSKSDASFVGNSQQNSLSATTSSPSTPELVEPVPTQPIESITSKSITTAVANLLALDSNHAAIGSLAVHEPPETNIWDVYSFSGITQKTVVNSATGIIVMLIYDRGGYIHPTHPVNSVSSFSFEQLNKTNLALESFSQAVQLIKRGLLSSSLHDELSYTSFYRLDRMEEKNYQVVDLLTRLKIKEEELPAVVMFKHATPFERVPFIFPSETILNPYQLSDMIRTAVVETNKLKIGKDSMDRILEESGLKDYKVIDSSTLSPEELKQYLRMTPQD